MTNHANSRKVMRHVTFASGLVQFSCLFQDGKILKKRMRYDALFRLKAVELAKETNNLEAVRQYGINEK